MTEESAHDQLMVPDILMPVQYYDGMRRDNPETQAVKRLMFVVLADAVRCFQTYADAQSGAGRQMFGETEWWILDRNSDGPFTFVAICEALGIDPDCLRNGLHQWRLQEFGGMDFFTAQVPGTLAKVIWASSCASVRSPSSEPVRVCGASCTLTMPPQQRWLR